LFKNINELTYPINTLQYQIGCLALKGIKIKHTSKTKADIKLCATSFSVETFFLLGQGHLIGAVKGTRPTSTDCFFR
jgi:hypothetical protein